MTSVEDRRRLMLISNSFCFGKGYLEHCAEAILEFLGTIRSLVFIPFALKDWNKYLQIARAGFDKMGIKATGIHELEPVNKPDQVIRDAEAGFVGGGNTFRLLNLLYKTNVYSGLRQRVNEGMPYLGASAGSNMACPTIMTTNDMPIVFPPSFAALGFVPFQINPHYIDPDPNSKHMGETRDKRIAEFHEENGPDVIGLREGSWIIVEEGSATLHGTTGAKIFVKGEQPKEWEPGRRLVL